MFRSGGAPMYHPSAVWVTSIAGLATPGATSGHHLEVPIRELAALADRRGSGKHQLPSPFVLGRTGSLACLPRDMR
jgi:hypothetical protein